MNPLFYSPKGSSLFCIIFIVPMNPCPCGYYPDRNICHCAPWQIRKYQKKISGPILDRLDLFVRCDRVDYKTLTADASEETSYMIQKRIRQAWTIQEKRFSGGKPHFNGRMNSREVKELCQTDFATDKLLEQAYDSYHMTSRSLHHVLKVSRTIADLFQEERIRVEHVEEALLYRNVSLWNNY